VVALRYFTVYGPRQRPDMAFSRVMRAALSGRAVPLYGSGAQRRDFTHVTDAVAATIAAATAEARSEVVNVASGRSVPLVQAVQTIASLAGAEVPALRRAAQPGDADATAADLAKARDLLGYEPQVNLADGLRSQWEWLADQEHPASLTAVEAAR
jgi:nucleoside-diphosphate-sugar epimerase